MPCGCGKKRATRSVQAKKSSSVQRAPNARHVARAPAAARCQSSACQDDAVYVSVDDCDTCNQTTSCTANDDVCTSNACNSCDNDVQYASVTSCDYTNTQVERHKHVKNFHNVKTIIHDVVHNMNTIQSHVVNNPIQGQVTQTIEDEPEICGQECGYNVSRAPTVNRHSRSAGRRAQKNW